jgi:hypothetical protein
MEQGRQKEDDPIEVSYTVLRSVNQRNRSDIIQKVVAAINVQLTLENNQSIPLISPNDFDTVKHQDKLFISGPSGCGKSRCIYELFKDKLNNVENIFVINPRQTIGDESGRVSIPKLANRLNQKDIVIWDNFPDDLLKRDVESAREVLETISVKDVMNFLVALKPKYLEIYRGITRKVPELYDYEIAYDKERIRSIITSYGKNIIQFTDVYEKYVLQNVHYISTILWQKEPLPITILAYYRELVRKQGEMKGESMDVVLEADKLMRRTDYYKHQFAFISNLEDRQNDMDFLYTLKLCYESGLNRAPALIHQLQKGIFNSIPPKEPIRKLSTWIYLSGQYYSMHDAPGEAIEFSKDVKLKIISYLTDNFSKVIPSEDNQIYLFGMFFGRNIDLIAHGTAYDFLPDHIYNYMKSKRHFEAGLGQGTGEIFSSLDYPIQDKILRRVEIDGEFAKWLGYGLGSSFVSLDKGRQVSILNTIIRKSIPFARGLGESLGYKFAEMPQELKEEIIKVLLINENFQFSRGLGMGLGLTFLQLDEQVKRKIFDFITKSYQFAIGIGYGLGNIFPSLPKDFQREIFERAEKNGELTRGLGIGLGNIFPSLPKDFQREIFERAEKNMQFAYGLGYQLGYNINLMNKELKKEVFAKIDKNSEFASGLSLGLGLSFTYLPREFQEKLFRLTEENIQFAYGLSYGFGFIFNYLPEQLRLDLFARIERNSEFAKGLGYGLGYIFSVLDNDFQNDVFARMEENSEFAYGLGEGVGLIYEHIPSNLREGIFKRAEKNSKFMRGLGDGFGFAFGSKNEKLQQDIFRLIERNSELAIGLGIGLRYSFAYLSTQSQEEVKRRAKGNIQFAYGLGIGLGCVFVYLKDSLKNELFEMAERNDHFAAGLGGGLSNLFAFINKDFQEEIFKRAEKNSRFMRGFGIGLGKIFPYINKESQSELFAKAKNNVEFAIGLGEGFGHIFAYLKKELRDKILEDLDKESSDENDDMGDIQDHNLRNGNGFSRGLGIGLGKNFTYIRKKLGVRIFAKAAANVQFAIGLGEGLGHIFSYLSDELQSKILQKSNEYPLARGLGMGLGNVLCYLHNNEGLQNKIFEQIDKNTIFTKSLGASLSYNFSPLNDHGLIQKILSITDDKLDYDESSFSNDYPTKGLPKNTYYYCTNKEDEITDQNIIDDEMKEYLQIVMDEMKNKADNNKMNNL